MKTHSKTDTEALARGQLIGGQAFQSLFADLDAVAELAKLLQVADVLGPIREERVEAPDVAAMDYSFDDLARFGENLVRDPQRRQAIHAFLESHGLLQPAIGDTDPTPFPKRGDEPTKHDTVRGEGDTDTKIEPGKPTQPPRTRTD